MQYKSSALSTVSKTRFWSRSVPVLLLGLMLLLLLFSTSLLAAQDTVAPAPVGFRPDAPTYALHGPYWVGTQTFVGEDVDGPLDIRVWYPALNPSGEEVDMSYTMHWKAEGLGFTRDQLLVVIAGHALADADVDLSGAPYPLFVISHGHNSESPYYAWLAERVASYGFVVVAPDHKEQNTPGWEDGPRTNLARPVTVSRAIDYAGTLTAGTGAFAGMIDMDHIAMAGQSGGGTTTLSIAGGRFEMETYAELCATVTPDSAPAFQTACLPMPDFTVSEMTRILGLDAPPQGLWPSMADPRVDAAIPMSSEGYWFNEQGLAEITMPLLVIGGTADNSVPYDWGIRPVYDYASSQRKALVNLENSDHFIFAPSCADAPTSIELFGNVFYYLCSDPVWDIDRAHDLVNHFVIAFLLAELKGDAEAAAALAPDVVSFPGIAYEAQGF